MAAIEEKTRKHATLSASSAHRWMTCTPSARFEEQFVEERSQYAEEGTFAHRMAEIKLRQLAGEYTKRVRNTMLNGLKKDELYSQEMEDYVDGYVEIVTERFNAARARCKDAVLLLEQRLDFSDYVPEGFGTGDVVIISEPTMEVVDLKYGAGVPVSALGNPQTRLYGLGALSRYDLAYDIQTVRMTIVQPRLDSVSTEELSAEELYAWGKHSVAPQAELAIEGKGQFIPGEHCRFCRGRIACRARAEYNLQLAQYDFAKPPELSDEDIAEILGKIDELVTWAGQVKDYALDQAVNHDKHWPGWKLVEGRSTRKYSDTDAVADRLVKAGYDEALLYTRQLLGITAMEKVIGKKTFAELLADLVIKPAGKPVLVPESDKRPAYNSAASAAEDFKN